MVTEVINVKLETNFLKDIDSLVKNQNYQSRTEFIRAALRQKVEDEKNKEWITKLSALKGSLKKGKQTTDEEIHRIKDLVFDEFDKKLK